jgi:hypothetical protein
MFAPNSDVEKQRMDLEAQSDPGLDNLSKLYVGVSCNHYLATTT